MKLKKRFNQDKYPLFHGNSQKVTPNYLVDPRTQSMTHGEYIFERVNEWLDEWFGNVHENKVCPEIWNDKFLL